MMSCAWASSYCSLSEKVFPLSAFHISSNMVKAAQIRKIDAHIRVSMSFLFWLISLKYSFEYFPLLKIRFLIFHQDHVCVLCAYHTPSPSCIRVKCSVSSELLPKFLSGSSFASKEAVITCTLFRSVIPYPFL